MPELMVKRELAKLKYSLGRMERDLKISDSTFSRWFTGQRGPDSIEHTRAILAKLKEVGISQRAIDELIEVTMKQGGKPAANLQELQEARLLASPCDESNSLTIEEAAMIHEVLSPQALDMLGLKFQPFDGIGDSRDVYLSQQMQAIVDQTIRVITGSASMVVLTGDTGSGKTTLMRVAMERLEREYQYRVVEPDILDLRSFDEGVFQQAIIESLGLKVKVCDNAQQRGRAIREALAKRENTNIVFWLDQAEDVRDEALVFLKCANAWTKGWRLLVRVVISGQEQILSRLRTENNRQVVLRADLQQVPQILPAWPFVSFRLQRAGLSLREIEKKFPKETQAAFEAKMKALAISGRVTARNIENYAAAAINWAAIWSDDGIISPKAVEQVQSSDRRPGAAQRKAAGEITSAAVRRSA